MKTKFNIRLDEKLLSAARAYVEAQPRGDGVTLTALFEQALATELRARGIDVAPGPLEPGEQTALDSEREARRGGGDKNG